MINILAHRGYWTASIKRNSPEAIRKSLENGYGFESDVRDYMGKMVISHNIADSTCQEAEEVFKWLHEFGDKYTFAINIKSDGLKEMLEDCLGRYNISNYFLFDMSVPQMIEFRDMGLKFFTRQSEVEKVPCMYEDSSGIWVDAFWDNKWITKELLIEHLTNHKQICIVSPDLHGRADYKEFWKKLKGYEIGTGDMMLCTDHPDEAKEVFYGNY